MYYILENSVRIKDIRVISIMQKYKQALEVKDYWLKLNPHKQYLIVRDCP